MSEFGDSNGNWGFDVLSASLHDSGILSSNALQDNNDVSFNKVINVSYCYIIVKYLLSEAKGNFS